MLQGGCEEGFQDLEREKLLTTGEKRTAADIKLG